GGGRAGNGSFVPVTRAANRPLRNPRKHGWHGLRCQTTEAPFNAGQARRKERSMETTPDNTPYTGIDQASNGLPLAPQAENRRESNFRRLDHAPRATTAPSRLEVERAELPSYPRIRR